MFRASGARLAWVSRYRVTVTGSWSDGPEPEKVGEKVKFTVVSVGAWADWNRSPPRALRSTVAPSSRGWPPMVSTPEPESGRLRMVMLSSTAWLPDWTTKSSGSKTMTLPMRPFLEKSSIFGPSAFLFQKKPEAGALRGHSRASASSSANARAEKKPGKRGRFMEGDLLKMRCP